VRLLGDRSDVPELLAAADGLILPSRWEGLPMILLEAAAAGLPIVATDVGGNAEVADPGHGGVLVDVEVSNIAAGMAELMAKPEEERRALGDALREHVRAGYDMTAVLERWMAMYRELAGTG
jgi:glycosyltransferase involved in cell wall biosynthesis